MAALQVDITLCLPDLDASTDCGPLAMPCVARHRIWAMSAPPSAECLPGSRAGTSLSLP
jgi:hypothetical protein